MPHAVQDCYRSKGCLPEWKGLEWSQVNIHSYTIYTHKHLLPQCSATCDGVQKRRIECKLGNETLPSNRCPIGKPSIIQRCGPVCPVLEICNKEFCHLDGLGSCPQKCCNTCKAILTQLTPLLRYKLCEKACCKECS